MNIRNTRFLRSFASQRVDESQSQKQIVLIYAAITLGLMGLVPIVNHLIGLQIDQYGGLSHMGRRSTLSAIQTMLPIAMNFLIMCLDLGYVAAMLRIARGQYVSPQTLRLGFDRFWLLLRSQILQAVILIGALVLGVYLGLFVFMVTPLSREVYEILTPYLGTITDPTALMMEEAVYSQFLSAAVPAYVLCGIFCVLLGAPVLYSYRMINYLIIDNPGMGAMEALRKSKRMMRGNRRYLLKLDIFQWRYYLALLAALALYYGDMLLPLMGVRLPGHEDIWYFVSLGLYLAALFAVYYLLRNRVDTAYALAYDAVKPEEPKDSAVVLGNIFQM